MALKKKKGSQLRTDFKDVINIVDMLFTGMLIKLDAWMPRCNECM